MTDYSAPHQRFDNMDAVRYVLAFSVLISHFYTLTGLGDNWWPIPSSVAVGGFFALSGFLVYPSYERHRRMGRYIGSRARRILPPYFLIVIAAAVGLVFCSSLSAADYFLSADFWRYLGANICFLNFLHPSLPGVFDGPEYAMPAVNGSLWTMKVEWLLYLSVPAVSWLTLRIRRRRTVVFLLIIVMSVVWRVVFRQMYADTGRELYNILSRQIFGQLDYFYIGVLCYFYYRLLIRYRWPILAVCCLLLPIGGEVVAPAACAVLVLWVSLVGDWGKRLSHGDNVSYDMYLFHFPIIQVAIYMGVDTLHPLAGLAAVTAVTVAASWLSWHFVGRRFKSQARQRGEKLESLGR